MIPLAVPLLLQDGPQLHLWNSLNCFRRQSALKYTLLFLSDPTVQDARTVRIVKFLLHQSLRYYSLFQSSSLETHIWTRVKHFGDVVGKSFTMFHADCKVLHHFITLQGIPELCIPSYRPSFNQSDPDAITIGKETKLVVLSYASKLIFLHRKMNSGSNSSNQRLGMSMTVS